MNHWDARSEALLARARAAERIPAGARARVKSAISNSIALSALAGASVSVLSAPTAFAKLPAAVKSAGSLIPIGSATASLGASGAATLLAPVAVGIALGLSAVSPSQSTSPPGQAAALVTSPVPVGGKSPNQARPNTRSLHAVHEVERVRTPSHAPPAISAKQPVASSSLAEEAEALEHARLSLRQGDADLCLRLLEAYRRRFPSGVFAFEAAATRAEALCRAGRNAEGLQVLRQIEVKSPGSGVLGRVRAFCGASGESVGRSEE